MELSISDFHSNDKKQFWKVVRHFVKGNGCTSSSIPPLNSFPVTGQNEFCFSEDKAGLLNKYSTSISTVNDENMPLPALKYKCQNTLSSITWTPHEVAYLSELLDPNKGNRA